ncbi:hypothetical protein HHK36_028642 [Tetracentron sinense]|uniref:DUF547 domain-containing protein n=1 Tax=Tetracentron sinense TaxID=13715 RepID=A0A835D0M9_TETSI|nr:hypothetical protein HHK36_028642 [Tetracentron sinense]
MGGFTVDGDGDRGAERKCGESWASSHDQAQHRRSKSASERNLDVARNGVPHSMAKNLNLSNIEQLQLHLQQEKSMRTMLERAMGRASSTLSPGHRHFAAQTKELIAEIELLEEEVANREQHVLSLYRSIFDHCVSGAPSKQSSGMNSPAHTKNEVRKHPSIISSAFCSSKKFPLQPFQALASIKDSGKKNVLLQSKTRHASLLSGKTNIHFEDNCPDPIKLVLCDFYLIDPLDYEILGFGFNFRKRSKLSSRSVICVFLGYGEGKKGYRCFDPITQKLYVSRHVVFLEYIPFFSIPSTTHALTRSDLVRIDPFSEDSDSLSSQVPSTSNTPSHVLPPLPLHYTRRIRTDHSAGTDTLLSGTPEAPSSPMVHQAPSEIVDPPLRQSIRIQISFDLGSGLTVSIIGLNGSYSSFIWIWIDDYVVSFVDPEWKPCLATSSRFLPQMHEKVPAVQKTSLARTLKDHLYQCPSKLSEELVRSMAAIYGWLRSSTSSKPEKNRSPLLSRSSTSVILPRRGTGEDRDWSSKSMVEISWISTDNNQFSRASFAINNYRARSIHMFLIFVNFRVLVEQLERVNASQMGSNAQTAFWINVYNSLVMHAYLAYGIPHGSLKRVALFHKAAYNIGGHVISANAIEQSIFCFRNPRIGRWYEAILSTAMRKKSGDERQLIIGSRFSLRNSQPLICFALCTGASSDPVLKVYTAANVKDELEVAKKDFLQANVVVKKSRKVFLPKILERFAKEASISSDDLLKWVSENVDKKLHDPIQKCIDSKTKRKASQIIEWLPYSTRFRYVFAKDLTEKTWL